MLMSRLGASSQSSVGIRATYMIHQIGTYVRYVFPLCLNFVSQASKTESGMFSVPTFAETLITWSSSLILVKPGLKPMAEICRKSLRMRKPYQYQSHPVRI